MKVWNPARISGQARGPAALGVSRRPLARQPLPISPTTASERLRWRAPDRNVAASGWAVGRCQNDAAPRASCRPHLSKYVACGCSSPCTRRSRRPSGGCTGARAGSGDRMAACARPSAGIDCATADPPRTTIAVIRAAPRRTMRPISIPLSPSPSEARLRTTRDSRANLQSPIADHQPPTTLQAGCRCSQQAGWRCSEAAPGGRSRCACRVRQTELGTPRARMQVARHSGRSPRPHIPCTRDGHQVSRRPVSATRQPSARRRNDSQPTHSREASARTASSSRAARTLERLEPFALHVGEQQPLLRPGNQSVKKARRRSTDGTKRAVRR